MLKRAFDVLFSGIVLLITAPLLAVIAVLIALDSGFPVLYCQERVGRGFQAFRMYKFRTMRVENTGPAITVAGDRRVTRLGRLLRAAKLDELPQFWNVLKGDMSVVGPRPEVAQYVQMYAERYRRILKLRPGITDLSSIAFRNEPEILARSPDPMHVYLSQVLPAKLDLADTYIVTRSFTGDVRIIVQTLFVTLRPSGRTPRSQKPSTKHRLTKG